MKKLLSLLILLLNIYHPCAAAEGYINTEHEYADFGDLGTTLTSWGSSENLNTLPDPFKPLSKIRWQTIKNRRYYTIVQDEDLKSFTLFLENTLNLDKEEPDEYLKPNRAGISYVTQLNSSCRKQLGIEDEHSELLRRLPNNLLKKYHTKEIQKIRIYRLFFDTYHYNLADCNLLSEVTRLEASNKTRPNPFMAEYYAEELEIRGVIIE